LEIFKGQEKDFQPVGEASLIQRKDCKPCFEGRVALAKEAEIL